MEIEICIHSPKSKQPIDIKVNENDTIGSVKEKYYSIVGSRRNNQWLYFGAVLKDDETILTLGIENKDIIEANPSSRGGGPFDMADISNEKGIVRCNYGKNSPKWNGIMEGLNVDGIEIYVESPHERKGIAIKVNENDTIGSVKEKYYSIVGSRTNNQWLYEGFVLKDYETILTLGIENKDIIEAHPSSRGGGGIDMADISNEKGIVRCNYGKNAAKWNGIMEGLNVDGICKNEKCEAYNQEVDCPIGIGSFDLVRDADRIKCPICNNEIDPTNIK